MSSKGSSGSIAAIGAITAIIAIALSLALLGVATPARGADAREDARILHLLGRAAFGPTHELFAEVQRVGRQAWLAEQLSPDQIADPALDAKLAIYPALQMTSAELLASYPQSAGGMPQAGIGPPGRIPVELAAAQVTRAVHARAQLREVLVDFWFNHFNVNAADGPTRYSVIAYLRDAIRPHVLGSFEDLLRATAESPAMLYYLDNYLSTSSRARGRAQGINENYARELMELHTLGVDGGYTQQDVIELARVLTGWTITPPRTGLLEFQFVPEIHDTGSKVLLGTRVAPAGQEEGLAVLRMLATHPSTARNVARKLVTRLVADDPPEALVERASYVFLATRGHLGWVVGSILLSEEFSDPAYHSAKVKTPLELVASSLRAVRADVRLGVEAVRLVAGLGQPLLRADPPTGWPEETEEILSPGGMVSRFDFAYRVVANLVEGAEVNDELWPAIFQLWGTPGLARYVLHRDPGPDTRAALDEAAAAGAEPAVLAALVLASPEFQQQ